jgi:hypothetical protein
MYISILKCGPGLLFIGLSWPSVQVEFDMPELDKLETSYRELGNTLEASHRKTLASFDKVVGSFRIASPQIDDPEKVSNQELQSDVENADPLDHGQIDLADESQAVEFTIPEQTEVILR